ncbi:hypothetical protein CC86DRAFT_447687 [Ophiobolus disseminans]|uniref:EF-hand n=1 Tax=Ophiobolus disseminans TaxID=1469910 RepID=A0A6A6ZQA3_9PLEO|nr:hypothetical protein CC86DRAFT_447687 [Ophiobolus disseminans]
MACTEATPVHGAQIALSPLDLISPHEVRHLVTQQRPHATSGELEDALEHVYSTFLDRLLALVISARPPSPAEVELIARWVADQHRISYLDNAAVARAVERHISTLVDTGIPAVDGAESVAPTDIPWGVDDEDTEGDGVNLNAQTLQRTLYHIAEDRARQEGVIHRGITCNGCDEKPIRGIRWHCANCADFDLCANCEALNSHTKTHVFYKIRVPAPYLGTAKQEPLYPGKPHMMPPSVHSALKRRLVAETNMEAEEVDALWDQFTCLAGTEWLSDPNNVGWALDRRAFNHAFVPRYTSFIAAPNLIYDRIFSYYDSDKNGLIGFEEWIKGLDGMHASNGQVKSRIVFNGYDVDGDGYISRKDILRIFRAYYAIEKEATRNYVAEITEELSVRNALDTIRSSQPLGSAFPPHGLVGHHGHNAHLREKNQDDFENTDPVLRDDQPDVADREEMLRASNIRNVGLAELPESEQNRLITDRWARRQFYVDEEEGFGRPGGVNDNDHDNARLQRNDLVDAGEHSEDLASTTNESAARPRWSRSSSRVRFQDDVDMETRSNASTSSRPVGERWGGYEIPEPEKDLGTEVLYQITQQGFNELLNPLFEDKENNAMDASATRSERRELAACLEQINEQFKTQELKQLRAICKIGIFRYSKLSVDLFCNTMNTVSASNGLRSLFYSSDDVSVGYEEARKRLLHTYSSTQDSLLSTLSVPDDWIVDDISLWNTWLCRIQLQKEVLAAALESISRLGWIPSESSEMASRDPTMPQFRPNSLADVIATSLPTASVDGSSSRNDSASIMTDTYWFYPDEEDIHADLRGPFFICSTPKSEDTGADNSETIAEEGVATPSSLPALLIGGSSPLVVQEPMPPLEEPSVESNAIHWRNYTSNPMMCFLRVETENNAEVLRSSHRAVVHSSDPFHPETDQSKPLYRHVRELAMDPKSPSHHILLASLEAVQQEIHERKGSGLISFEEFDEHMQEGRLRFLESWMEWVSI